MKKSSLSLVTPVARMLQGSLYVPFTKDAQGNPLVYKSGSKKGEPRVNYYFSAGIAKNPGESSWKDTAWGKEIFKFASEISPSNFSSSKFSWKITDGDSDVPNDRGVKPRNREGFAGNWVLNFSNGFAPVITDATGSNQIKEENFLNPGDYMQIHVIVVGNSSQLNPGIILNPRHVAFRAYGKKIVYAQDPKELGFGQAALPVGASLTPITEQINFNNFNPVEISESNLEEIPAYPQILDAPAPAVHKMTEKAQGTYDQYVSKNWTDAQLIQHGLMLP